MLKKLKRKIFNFLRPRKEIKYIRNEITFPGGIKGIAKTEEEDVFIVGFPKSGNTLMQHIVAHLYYGLNQEASRSLINLITPDIYANPHYFRFNDVCFFKSHERPQPNYRKVIYLIRDGREAMLSYYHMMKNMGRNVSKEDLFSDNVKIFGGNWDEHIKAWEENPYDAQILWVKFEDLKRDKLSQIKRICDFLKLDRTDNELDNVINNTSLIHMKELELRKDWQIMNAKANLNKGGFVRKGEVSSYKEEVSTYLLEEFEKNNITSLEKHYNI